jgi:glycosyltransferase involved in cell wall biosynthesis
MTSRDTRSPDGAKSRAAATSREWHIVTCEYPPCIGGVSDYTFTLAAALAPAHPVHVWCPAGGGQLPASPGVTVHPDLRRFSPRDLWRTGARLNGRPGPRHLFVQWVPQGFGYRSLNVWFAAWLACRAWLRHDELHLMIHEPFLEFSPHPLRVVVALLHRVMLAIAGSGAAHIWLSTATWKSQVRPYVPAKTPIEWLPVPAPRLLAPTGARTGVRQTATDSGVGPVVGHFGTHSVLVTRILAPALDVVLRHPTASVLLVGRDSDTFRDAFLETRPHATDRVRATGALGPESVSRSLRSCDLMIQPYADGLTSRRTSTLTLLALGLAVVTNTGPRTEPFWSGCGAVELAGAPNGSSIGEAAVRLLDDEQRRTALAARALQVYDRCFDSRHATAMLDAAAWPLVDASDRQAERPVVAEGLAERP